MPTNEELEQYLILVKKGDTNRECPVKSALEILGGRWKLRILAALLRKEIIRFNELKRIISGITNTMLSNSLHELERDGLITRTQYNEMPIKVEYRLTNKGNSLLPIFYELTKWWTLYKE